MARAVTYTLGGVAAAVAAAGIVGLIVGAAQSRGAFTDLPNPKEWQTLIGAAVGIIAALLAWNNVRTTIRTNLMSREEDRIERAMPGIRGALNLLSGIEYRMKGEFDANDIRKCFASMNFEVSKNRAHEDIEKLLPSTDDLVRFAIATRVGIILLAAELLSRHEVDAATATNPQIKASCLQEAKGIKDRINATLRELADMRVMIEERERLLRQRLPILRAHIDRFLWND